MLPEFLVDSGSFARPTSLEDTTISGLSFEPKAIIMYGCNSVAGGDNAEARLTVGFSDGDFNQGNSQTTLRNSGDTNFTCSLNQLGSIYGIYINLGGSYSIEALGYITAINSDGFVLTWTTVDANSPEVYWIALGGEALRGSYVGYEKLNTTTGFQAFVQGGISADVVLAMTTRRVQAGTSQEMGISTGFGTNEANGGGTGGCTLISAADDSIAPTNTWRALRASLFFGVIDPNTGAYSRNGTFTGTYAGGFRINNGVASADDEYLMYLVLRGVTGRMLTFNQPTSTGNQSQIAFPFQPTCVWFQNFTRIAALAIQSNLRAGRGFACSSSKQFHIFNGSTDNVNPPVSRDDANSTKCIRQLDETGSGVTLYSQASLVSFDAAGFTVNWDTVDSTARVNQYFALAAKPIYYGRFLDYHDGNYKVVVKEFNFNDDEQGWVVSQGAWDATVGVGGTGGFYNTGTSTGKGCTKYLILEWSGTFEDLGVPAGRTVDYVVAGYGDYETGVDAKGNGNTACEIQFFRLTDAAENILWSILAEPYTIQSPSWKRYLMANEGSVTYLALPSNTSVKLMYQAYSRVASGGLGVCAQYLDNVVVSIKYR